MQQDRTESKENEPFDNKNRIRQGSLSHQKAIVCKGKMGPHGWDLKKKRYEKEST